MAEAVNTIYYKRAVITSLDGSQTVDLSKAIQRFNYFENILEHSITATIEIKSSYSYVNQLPIRGGERVDIELLTSFGKSSGPDAGFNLTGDTPLFVYKVSDRKIIRMVEECTLHLTSLENFSNDSTRCLRKYQKLQISSHVEDILKNTLQTKKDINIEPTANSYSFIGNSKKPFYTISWLGSKSISQVTEVSGVSGKDKYGKNKGTAGFLFYENKKGFHFRSIDSLVSNAQLQNRSSDIEPKISYNFSGKIIEEAKLYNSLKIIDVNFPKNIDLRKALAIGMYSNDFYYYDTRKNEVSLYNYNLKEEIQSSTKLGNEESLTVNSEFANIPTRTMFRTSDHGTLDPSGSLTESQSDSGGDAMLAKSSSRINLLFTQSLNILVPLNVELTIGDFIYCEFPKFEGGGAMEVDDQSSGNYVIRKLCHHFEAGASTSSLTLMRDSYGLYGPNQ